MRVLVSGAGGFVGAHVDLALLRAGHERIDVVRTNGREQARYDRAVRDGVDAVIHLSPDGVRTILDVAFAAGAGIVVLLSVLGVDGPSPGRQLAHRRKAEELVRASGMPWAVLRPEILWGPGDVFTNEIAHLLRHLPFVPVPRGGPILAPVHVGDAAHALVELLDRRSLWRKEWAYLGPETLSHAEIIERVARSIRDDRARLEVSPWSLRLGAAFEERIAHRPKVTRALLDRLAAGAASRAATEPRARADEADQIPLAVPQTHMTPDLLETYLWPPRPPAEQLAEAGEVKTAAAGLSDDEARAQLGAVLVLRKTKRPARRR